MELKFILQKLWKNLWIQFKLVLLKYFFKYFLIIHSYYLLLLFRACINLCSASLLQNTFYKNLSTIALDDIYFGISKHNASHILLPSMSIFEEASFSYDKKKCSWIQIPYFLFSSGSHLLFAIWEKSITASQILIQLHITNARWIAINLAHEKKNRPDIARDRRSRDGFHKTLRIQKVQWVVSQSHL